MLREFSCPNGHRHERLLSTQQDALIASLVCPDCGAEAARVEFSRCGFLLMPGSGGFERPHSLAHERATRPVTTGGGKNIPDLPGVTNEAKT